MFKISISDTPSKRTLLVEGTLVAPWTTELRRAWRDAGQDLEGRTLVIDLKNVTVIGQEGENTLFELMSDGANFSGCGVLTKHVLKQIARRCQDKVHDVLNSTAARKTECDGGDDVESKSNGRLEGRPIRN